MNNLLLAYGLFVLAAVSFLSFVEAEIQVIQNNLTEAEQLTLDNLAPLTVEIEVYSGNVTVPLKHPLESKECKWYPAENPVFTDCRFFGPVITKENSITNQTTITNGSNTGITLSDGIDTGDAPQDDPDVWDLLEDRLQKEKARGTLDPSDERLLEALEDRDECFDGDSNSVGIQNYRGVLDPEVSYNATDNTDLDSNVMLRKVLKSDQHCEADKILDNEIHTEEHRNKTIKHWWFKENLIPDWRYNLYLEHGIKYPTLNDNSYDKANRAALNALCNIAGADNISEYYGCPEKEPKTDPENPASSNIKSQNNPFFETEKTAEWVEYKKYMSGDESQQLTKAIKVNKERQAAKDKNYGGQK